MNSQNVYDFVVGVDVSKNTLEVAIQGVIRSIENSTKAIEILISSLADSQVFVVMEATGGYETELVARLHEHGIPLAVVNPRRVRDFAKGIGRDAKTDRIDAAVIAFFGEVTKPAPQLAQPDDAKKRKALVERRKQLLGLIGQENNRLQQTNDTEVKEFIEKSLEMLKKQLKSVDDRLSKMLAEVTETDERKIAIMQSVKGVGPVAICTFLAELPELGTLSRTEIAKLVGVAPINNDSGQRAGKRTTMGGRRYVRRVLYMATLSATRYNPTIREFYQRLVAKGKAKKVALIAAMRKLLTIINTLVKNDELWRVTD